MEKKNKTFAPQITIFCQSMYTSVKYGSVGTNALNTTCTCFIGYLRTKVAYCSRFTFSPEFVTLSTISGNIFCILVQEFTNYAQIQE